MAIQKQNVDISFAQGLDLKTDPFRVQAGKFLALENTVFGVDGLLQKRNGYDELTQVSDECNTLTTFGETLISLGSSLQTFSPILNTWTDKGDTANISFESSSVFSQISHSASGGVFTVDNLHSSQATDSGGLTCVINQTQYQIIETRTGNKIVDRTNIEVTNNIPFTPQVYVFANHFIIVYLNVEGGVTISIKMKAIPIATPTSPLSSVTITTAASAVSLFGRDCEVLGNTLYVAYISSSAGLPVGIITINSSLVISAPTLLASTATAGTSVWISLAKDTVTNRLWVTYYDGATNKDTYSALYTSALVQVLAPTLILDNTVLKGLATIVKTSVLQVVYEVANVYGYSSGTATDYISKNTVTAAGTIGTAAIVVRSVGLVSELFISPVTNLVTFFVGYGLQGSNEQNLYFMMDTSATILLKLAPLNAFNYIRLYATGVHLFQVDLTANELFMAYLMTVQIEPSSRLIGGLPSTYSFSGVYLGIFNLQPTTAVSNIEIAECLNLAGGYIKMFDGSTLVELGFHLWPSSVHLGSSSTGGHLTDQQYYYVATYEWTDEAANVHRSAPSIPLSALVTGGGGGGTTSTITIDVPTLRLTDKTNAYINIYRWSTAQQVFHSIFDASIPGVANDKTVDYVSYTDTLADASIAGNEVLYTTGNVLENIAAPACSSIALFKSRLWCIPFENSSTIQYSKQIIDQVPVEFTPDLSIFVAPSTGVNKTTGIPKILFPMDDKLIIFKESGLNYLVGDGPDNTGNNNDFSAPVFISSPVGSDNPHSTVLTPQGVLFQASNDQGIWLLGRDLTVKFVGAPVSFYNGNTVLSTLSVPNSNRILFSLDNDVTLMYDYYYDQWGTFTGISPISNTVFEGLHSFLNDDGEIFQETLNEYLDGLDPVLMSFTTSWFNMAGIQGYERAYFFYLLGTYISPHTLDLTINYDYEDNLTQLVTITPDNADTGDSVEQWRVFMDTQKCQSFQIALQEQSVAPAGAGLTISSINLVVGLKKGYKPIAAANSAG